MGLWLILLSIAVLFMNGQVKYVIYFPILLVTAPVFLVYVPVYGSLTFTNESWGTRGENLGVHPKLKAHIGMTYIFTLVAVLVMTFAFYCDDMGTKCFF